METLQGNSIETKILSILRDGPLRTTEIIRRIKETRTLTPKESVYKAIRKLKKNEIIAIAGKVVSINQLWISKMKEFFEDVEIKYTDLKGDSILILKEKEYINYKFNSLESLDRFWSHAFIIFLKNYSSTKPVMSYTTHEWFILSRQGSANALIEQTKRQKLTWFQIIADKTPLDVKSKKYFENEFGECHVLGENVFPNNYYCDSFGDYIIEVWLDQDIADEIDELYKTYNDINDELIEKIILITKKEGYNHKMKISRNRSKTTKVLNLFKKYFFVK